MAQFAPSFQLPGLLSDEALKQQTDLYLKQQNDTATLAPPPNSATEFADKIVSENIIKAPPADRKAAQKLNIQQGGADMTGGVKVGVAGALPLVGPQLVVGAKALEQLGTLTEEQSQEATIKRAADTKASEDAMRSKAEVRARLRSLPDAQAEQMGLPTDPGGADFEERGRQTMQDAQAVQEQKAKADTSQAAVEGKAPKVTQTWWLNALQSGGRSFGQTLTSVPAGMFDYGEAVAQFYGIGDNQTQSAPRAWMSTVDAALTKMLPGDPAQAKDFVTKLSAGGGSMLAFLTTGYIAGAAGIPPGLAISSVGALSEGDALYKEAEEHNGTELQKFAALIMGAALGATEAIPIDRMFMRAEQATGGMITRLLRETSAGSLEEFIQETGQSLGEDLVAKYGAAYDQARQIDPKAILENGLVGALTGGATAVAVGAIGEAGGEAGGISDAEKETAAQAAIADAQRTFDAIEGIHDRELPLPRVEGGPDGAKAPDEVAPQLGRVETPLGAVTIRPTVAADGTPTVQVDAAEPVGEKTEFKGGTPPASLTPDGKVELTHWSSVPRAVLDPSRQGTGPLRGQERQRLHPDDPNYVPRTYYGIDAVTERSAKENKQLLKEGKQNEAGYQREGGLGDAQHTVEIDANDLYNWYEDPSNLKAKLDRTLAPTEQVTQYEKLIKDAGFKGYWINNSTLGQTAAVFEQMTPTAVRSARTGQPLTPQAEENIAAMLAPEVMQKFVRRAPGVADIIPHLTETEQNKLTERSVAKLEQIFTSLPPAVEFAAVAIAGQAKRGWYRKSARALVDIFGIHDAPRFTALLAALSPQTSVENNATNALNVWVAWIAAGRPTDPKRITSIINHNVIGPNNKALPAWVPNSILSLSHLDPAAIDFDISGPKVTSFMRNLRNEANEVTNDAWMANFANVDQSLFKGARKPGKGQPATKGVGYLAYSARVRQAAQAASALTGETWTAAEVQETVWSWARTLYNKVTEGKKAGKDTSAAKIIEAFGLTDEEIGSTPDFSSLFTSGAYGKILEAGGYGDRLKTAKSNAAADEGYGDRGGDEGGQARASALGLDQHLKRAAERLDQLRADRLGTVDDIEGEDDGLPSYTADEPAPVYATPDDALDYDFSAMRAPDELDMQRLPGLPPSSTGPIASVVEAARAYAEQEGIPLRRQAEYVHADPKRGARIAAEYEKMKHDPQDPAVAAAYKALIDETLKQYQFVKASGLVVEFIEPGQADPYPEGPKQVLADLQRGHLWTFPTDQGFGTLTEILDNPLLAPTEEFVGDRQLVANDVFRIVHDFFGHGLEGSGFGARGEENAWQSHMRLFSEAAIPAMTSETRGQNSWVNFGPHGEANRRNQKETVYADQKTGIMPDWTWKEGVADDEQFVAAKEAAAQAELDANIGTSAGRGRLKGEATRPAQGIAETPGKKAEPIDTNLALIGGNFIKILTKTAERFALRQGRLSVKGKNAVGQFSYKSAVARLRNWGDLSTMVHEGGHALHQAAEGKLTTFINRYGSELMTVADTLYGRGGGVGNPDTASLPRAEHVREGFAEFFRVYVLNRDYAVRNFPELTDQFGQLLAREMPEIDAGMDVIGQQYAAFLQAPSTKVLRDTIVSGVRESGINAAIAELRDAGFPTWFSEYARRNTGWVLNRYASLNQTVAELLNLYQSDGGKAIDLKRADDPRILARLAGNAGNRAMVQLRGGAMAYQATKPSTASLQAATIKAHGYNDDNQLKAINEELMGDFDAYLVALRALDEYRRYHEGKLARPPVDFTEGDLLQAAADFEKRYAGFQQAAMMVHDYGMALWKKAYDAGLMSQETYTSGLDRQFYVPLQRDLSDVKSSDLRASAVTQGRSIVKQFKGSGRNIISPMAVLMEKTFALEQTIAQNDIAKALATLADKVGRAGALVERVPASQMIGMTMSVEQVAKQLTKDDNISDMDAADLMTILSGSITEGNSIALFRREQVSTKGENIIFFWENGKVAAIQVKDGDAGADIVNMFNSIGHENMHWAMELLAGSSGLFRSAITLWPDFLVVNFIRDQMSTWILNEGFIPFATGIRGVGEELRQKDWAQQANASLMTMGGMNVASLNQARNARDLKALRGKDYIARVFADRTPFGILKGVARVSELTETGTRIGLYRKHYLRAKADGLTDYEASIEAGYAATDTMDFGLNGSKMLLARRTIPFLNAQLQGYYKMLRTLGGDEVRQRKGLRFVLGAYLKSTKNMELSRTEKAAIRTGRKAWIKMCSLGLISALLHWLFHDDPDYEEAGENLRQTAWIIPMGDGRLFYIPKPFELALIADATERALESASGDPTAWDRFGRGAAMSMLPPYSPPAIQLAVEVAMNKDTFTGREIVPDYMQALAPELQFNNYTSELAKTLGGVMGWSPLVTDHVMSGLFASAYRDVAAATNPVINPERPSMDSTDAPLLRRFIRDSKRGSASARDFWAQASTQDGRLRQAEVSYKSFLEAGNAPAANRFLNSLPPDEKAYAILASGFKAEAKRLNPIYRGRQVATIVSAMRREIASDLSLENTDKFADKANITLTAGAKRDLDEALGEYIRREMRNTLIATGAPGWVGKRYMRVDTTGDIIAHIDPRVKEELDRRLAKAKVYDARTVFETWPEVRNRLLQDHEEAFLDDLISTVKVTK